MSVSNANIEIYQLTKDDLQLFVKVIQLFADVFEMENFKIPSSSHLSNLLSKDDFMVFCAKDGESVIGGLTAYTLMQYYSVKPLAYIYDLAVDTSYQRKGIGKKLIASFNSYCMGKGYEEVFVQADKTDDNALDFYRKTQPTEEEHVSHFYYLLNQ
ncbi:GNAT family N-acetyltransferase [Ekhidna sp.]